MKPLQLTLNRTPDAPVDLSPLVPDLLAGMKMSRLNRLKIAHGKNTLRVERLFAVTGNDTNNIKITNSCNKLLYIGKGMGHGSIEVSGDVGDFAGQHMQGGTLRIQGNAGSWVGSGMVNGLIEIHGNVDDSPGAGLPGDAHGMSDGFIYISGNAGDRVGDRMRRGIIIICGSTGDYCGSRMQAGTIVVLQRTGEYPGTGMKRGTIVLARAPSHMAATFMSCGELKMQYLRLLFKQLGEVGKNYTFLKNYAPAAHRYAGDLASNGKGEILVLLKTPMKGK
ncbi:MAG: formylmethanofuran dehydrogenase subunit C [Gammaproteobacteria bacterium]